MKKLAATLLTLFITGSAFALPIGNPWEASIMRDGIFWEGNCGEFCDPCSSWCDAWSVRVGFYGDYVFNKHMEVDRSGDSSSIHDTEIYTNAAYLAFNLWDRFDLFGTLGASHLYIKTPQSAFGSADNGWELVETDTHFSWSIGLRGTVWECGCLGIGAEAQYFRTCPEINFLREESQAAEYKDGEELQYREWQVGLGAAYRINIASCATALIPYMGIKWNHVWIDMNEITSTTDITLFDLGNKHDFGYAVGVTLLGCNKGSVTVEGRFVNEKAVYFNGQFRF